MEKQITLDVGSVVWFWRERSKKRGTDTVVLRGTVARIHPDYLKTADRPGFGLHYSVVRDGSASYAALAYKPGRLFPTREEARDDAIRSLESEIAEIREQIKAIS